MPVFGWLGLSRESKLHGGGFWVRPMLLELLSGAVFALLYWWEVVRFGILPQIAAPGLDRGHIDFLAIRHEQFTAHLVLFCFMLVALWIDVDEMTIPDGITIPGTLAGLIFVTLWPFAFLPDSIEFPNGFFAKPMLTSVWLTSPDLPAGQNFAELPQYVPPWQRPACTGWPALAAAIAVFWAWCVALAPGRWYTRHGYFRAVKVFAARMVRERITHALLALAALGSAAIAVIWVRGGPHWIGMASGLAGIAIGGGLVWIVRILGSAVMGREAMGFGDVTLLAMIGAYLGWQAAIVVFFLAPFAAIAIGVGRLLLRGEREIPFGPFLCLATAATVLAWPMIWGSDLADKSFSLGWKLIAVLFGCLLFLMVVLLPPIRWIVTRLHRE